MEAPDTFCPVICVTGQHREMLRQFLDIFGIQPTHDMDIMSANQDLYDISVRVLLGMREILHKTQPDIVIVQGDTSTSFLAGLGAYYNQTPIAHVEAGLRTHNKYSPFPEEMNRHMLSALIDYHFCPTHGAKANLIKENVSEGLIWVTGNTVVDSLLFMNERLDEPQVRDRINNLFSDKYALSLDDEKQQIILVTGHRRENFGAGLESICRALRRISEAKPDIKVVYPVHLNPNVQNPVMSILGDRPNIILTGPLDYEPFVYLMKRSHFILTDSGGVQEEAPSLGKPVLVMRDTTERPEGVESGNVRLVGCDEETIVRSSLELLETGDLYQQMSHASNPYGDGKAAERILAALTSVIM